MDGRIRALVLSRPIPDALIDALAAAPLVPAHELDRWVETNRQLPRTGRDERPPKKRGKPLTDRQLRVLELSAAGLGRKQIAAALEISQDTTKNHLSRMRGRLGAKTTAQAVAIAFRLGVIT